MVASPRLAEFVRLADGADEDRLRSLWAEVASHGLPLVERLPDDPGHLRVTLAWRPVPPVASATVYTPIANPIAGENQLERLGETGVWYRSFALPRRTRALYAYSPRPLPDPSDGGGWAGYFRSLGPDPHNPVRLTMARDPDDPDDVATTVSVLALPGAPSQPWSRLRTKPPWKVDHTRMRSRHLRGERSVWVYTPPGFDAGRTDYTLLVALDGLSYQSIVPAPEIVGYLVAKRRIPPAVLVLVGNAAGARDEELLHNPRFARFLGGELVPRLRRAYRWTPRAERTVILGSSLGGLTAAFAALRYPRLFGNVLAQSGAFSWSKTGGMLGAPTLMDEYARAPRGPTRFYLDAGTLERTVFPGTQASLLAGVRHLRDVLVAKGYSVRYAEFEGGHDYACWAGTLADGLEILVGTRRRAR